MEDGGYTDMCHSSFMYRVIDWPIIVIWWIIADQIPSLISDCEIMTKLVCNISLMKDSNYRLTV